MSPKARMAARAAVVAVLLPVFAVSVALHARSGAGDVITPKEKYSDPAWSKKADKYNKNLERTKSGVEKKYDPSKVHFLTTQESAVGGVGLWGNPSEFGDPSRYLGVFARVRLPDPSTGRPFPDTETGRIMTVIDAYGKHAISVMAAELEKMQDPGIAGAAMILIYTRKPVTDPAFESQAEALALFMPKDAVIRFAQLRMTVQSLFSKSQMLPVMKGSEQIKNLRLYIIQP